MTSKTPYRRLANWGLALIAIAGALTSYHLDRQLRDLRRQRLRLAEQVGLIDATDEDRVYITRVPTGPDDVPPGVQKAHIWRFRIYLPAGYGPCFWTGRRAITADSPRNDGGRDSGWGGKEQDPVETQLTIAMLKTENGWILSRTSGSSASSSSVSKELPLDAFDDLLVEPIVTTETPSKSFSVDEAICVLRLRSHEPLDGREGQPTFYPGFVTYLFESDRRDAFEQWARGDVDAMPQVNP